MSTYVRLYVDENLSRINSDRHSSSDFDDAMARILNVIICKNMNAEEMLTIFDEIKSAIKRAGNTCYNQDYLCELKRRIERRKYNESRQKHRFNQT